MSLPESHLRFHTRMATLDDAVSITAVLRDAFAEFELLYTPEAYAATTPTPERLRTRWHEGPVWVALEMAQIVGTVAAVPDENSLNIRSMAVSPGFHRFGVGKLLLQHVEHFARVKKFRRMFLSTTPFLLGAIRLYEQCGFRQTTDGPRELFGTSLLTMAKRVDRGPRQS